MKVTLTTETGTGGLSAFRDALYSFDYHIEHMGDFLKRPTTAVVIEQDGSDIVVTVRLGPPKPEAKVDLPQAIAERLEDEVLNGAV